MYPKALLTNHQMEDDLETHLEEVHLEEIRLDNHLSIHLLDFINGSTWPAYVHTTMVSTTYYATCITTNHQFAIQEVIISNLCQRH
jgi:hypothetical protein